MKSFTDKQTLEKPTGISFLIFSALLRTGLIKVFVFAPVLPTGLKYTCVCSRVVASYYPWHKNGLQYVTNNK